jgi:hypothetical protein
MVIKGIEYYAKFQHHTLPGPYYNPVELPGTEHGAVPNVADIRPFGAHGEPTTRVAPGEPRQSTKTPGPPSDPANAAAVLKDAPMTVVADDGRLVEQSAVARAAQGPDGLNPDWVRRDEARMSKIALVPVNTEPIEEPDNAHIFFGIYFLMTGLHGLHVLAGMCLIFWIMLRARRGEFGPHYYSPVDFVGLYWHIVDLVWIFLFPLLYLIT